MQVGESRSAQVKARTRWNDTGIDLLEGQTYQLTATGTWRDCNIPAGPCGYESKNFILRFTERRRRAPHAKCFALIGSIGRNYDTQFLIGCSREYQVLRSGRLFCFANDVRIAYLNNSGEVKLTVTRSS
jgi:hypothetical protein